MESFVVPVLPYTSGRFSFSWALAAVPERVTSCNKLVITKAFRASMVRTDSSNGIGLGSFSMRPLSSVILLIR